MAAPLIFVVVSTAGRALVQYATRRAAANAAARVGGKVVEKTATKTVSKLPKGGSAQANKVLESNTLRASRAAPKGGKGPNIKPTQADRLGGAAKTKPKPNANAKPDVRGTGTQKGLLLTAATAPFMATGEKKKASTPARTPMKNVGGKGPKSAEQKAKIIDRVKGQVSEAAKGKKFNVGVSKGGVPFKEAFAHFRKKGAKTFTWNGKKYTTELKKDKK